MHRVGDLIPTAHEERQPCLSATCPGPSACCGDAGDGWREGVWEARLKASTGPPSPAQQDCVIYGPALDASLSTLQLANKLEEGKSVAAVAQCALRGCSSAGRFSQGRLSRSSLTHSSHFFKDPRLPRGNCEIAFGKSCVDMRSVLPRGDTRCLCGSRVIHSLSAATHACQLTSGVATKQILNFFFFFFGCAENKS